MASAEEVKKNTGFSIGGVAPVAHLFNLKVSLSLVLFPLSGANNTPRIPPIINPTIRLINEFVEFLLIIIYLL